MSFTKKLWKEDGTTPITAAELNRMEAGIDEASTTGSDVNGRWEKLQDGTMICWQKATIASSGTDFYNGSWTFTNAFIGNASVNINAYNNYHGTSANGCAQTYAQITGSTLNWGAQFGTSIPAGNSVFVDIIAIGRWK